MTEKVTALPVFSGKRLAKAMDKSKMTIHDLLLKMTGIKLDSRSALRPSRPLIENWLTDRSVPSDGYMVILTKALNCTEKDLRA